VFSQLAVVQYIQMNKDQDNDWFKIESNKLGTRWNGKCWTFYNGLKYEFDLEFEVSPPQHHSPKRS
jgi:ufm1-conjugating enzyme 1